MLLKDVVNACRRAVRGNTSAIAELGLDNVTYDRGKSMGTGQITLQTAYNPSLNTAVAARELSLFSLERQCQMTMNYIQTIATAKAIVLVHEIDPEDIAEIILALTDEAQLRSSTPSAHQSEEETAEENAEPSQDKGLDNRGIPVELRISLRTRISALLHPSLKLWL